MKFGLKILALSVFCLFSYVAFIFFKFDESALQRAFESRYSKMMLSHNDEILSVFLNQDEQWHLDAYFVPEKLKSAVIAYEDKRFYSHAGVDFLALLRAFKNNFLGEQKSGASTISMQVIKLYEKNTRTYANKFKEIIKALALERALSKDEILRLYLNNAPYGGNLIGFQAAILFYFDKSAKDLSWAEAALLAVLPNQPGLISLEKNKHLLKQKRDKLLKKMSKQGLISQNALNLALYEPLPSFKPRKNIAPHLALELLKNQRKISSSIDKNLQIKFEQKAREFSQNLKTKGILNLSILLLDTQSGKVLAYVGSQDFYDIKNLGQINGVVAKRSVGSLLKPFLFALSIDEGLIAPESILLDVPTFFSNFAPQNANKKYHGLIPAKEALKRSLNVPFVALLQDFGYEKFFYKMKEILDFNDEDYHKYGLSFILGTKEFSLEQMTRLYLALANYGQMREITYTKDEISKGEDSKRQIFSQGAAFLTLESLKDVRRTGLENFSKEKIISYKTGTSYGRKDAWAIAATPKYTLGVWAGNFSGEASANLYGVSVAGDLLFELFDFLDASLEFEPSQDLRPIKLETRSKYRLDEALSAEFVQALYPKSAKTLRFSPFLKRVFEYEGRELDSLSPDFTRARPVLKLDLPLNALNFLKKQKQSVKNAKSVAILYPKNHLSIVQTKGFETQNELIISVANLNDEELFYYLNQKLIYQGKESQLALRLEPKDYELFVISTSGQSDKVRFSVKK